MKIAVASGKGGVGKSMLAASLSVLFSKSKRLVAVDCDVDAPDLALWLGVEMAEFGTTIGEKISASEKAFIDYSKCIKCGRCAEACTFGAMKFDGSPTVLPYLCEGCGACELACPVSAIKLKPVDSGEIIQSETKYGFPVITGFLYPGETGSGKVVTEIKKHADKIDHEMMILDSAAGIGCPVTASLNGSDYALLVTEPTPSGISDLQRVLGVVEHFSIPYKIVINKWNINESLTEKIERKYSAAVIGRLPFDKAVFSAISSLTPVIETSSPVADGIRSIYKLLREELENRE